MQEFSTYVDIRPALYRWQAKHHQRLTMEQLAEKASISIASLYRLNAATSKDNSRIDLAKVNAICKALDCQPGEIILQKIEDGDVHNEPST